MAANGKAHHHDRHEHANSIIRNAKRSLSPYKECNDDNDGKSDRHRTGESAVLVPIHDYLRDLSDRHIPPFCGLQVLKSSHGGGGQQPHRQDLVSPV